MPRRAARAAIHQVQVPRSHLRGVECQMKPRLPVAHFPDHAQAVHRRREQVGVAAQESGVGVGELAGRAAVDLQDAERRPALAANDDDVGHRLDAVLDQERRIREPCLRRDVRGDHRLARFKGVALRVAVRGLERHLAHHAGRPADTRAHPQGGPVRLQLHDLGEIGAQGIADQAAGLGQHPVQTVGPQRKLPEPCQSGLLPQQRRVVAFFRIIQGHAPHRPPGALWLVGSPAEASGRRLDAVGEFIKPAGTLPGTVAA